MELLGTTRELKIFTNMWLKKIKTQNIGVWSLVKLRNKASLLRSWANWIRSPLRRNLPRSTKRKLRRKLSKSRHNRWRRWRPLRSKKERIYKAPRLRLLIKASKSWNLWGNMTTSKKTKLQGVWLLPRWALSVNSLNPRANPESTSMDSLWKCLGKNQLWFRRRKARRRDNLLKKKRKEFKEKKSWWNFPSMWNK